MGGYQGQPRGARATPGCGWGMRGRVRDKKPTASGPLVPSLAPSTLPVLAAELGLLLSASAGGDRMLHPAVSSQIYVFLSFHAHPHLAVFTRDDHSCVFEHHMLR